MEIDYRMLLQVWLIVAVSGVARRRRESSVLHLSVCAESEILSEYVEIKYRMFLQEFPADIRKFPCAVRCL